MEELLVTEPDPEEPGHHRVTGICLGTGNIKLFYPIVMIRDLN